MANKNNGTSPIHPITNLISTMEYTTTKDGSVRRSTRFAPMSNTSESTIRDLLLLDFSKGISFEDISSACGGLHHKHIFASVVYVSRYVPLDDETYGKQVENLLAVCHSFCSDKAHRMTQRRNLGSADVWKSKVKTIESILDGSVVWDAPKSSRSNGKPTKRWGSNAGSSLRQRLLARKGKGKADTTDSGDSKADGDKGNTTADTDAKREEIQKEIAKLEFALDYATKAKAKKLQARITELKAQLDE